LFDMASDLEASGNVSSKFLPAEAFEFIEAGGTV